MKFLYYIYAIGSNRIEDKLKIQIHNLNLIYRSLKHNFDIMINNFDSTEQIQNVINKKKIPFIDNIYIYTHTGILPELLLTSTNNNYIHNYTYICLILDDVVINSINISDMFEIQTKYNIEIMSPKVLDTTHDYMFNQNKNILAIVNAAELQCYFLTAAAFNKYLSMNTIDNKYTWGVDLAFGHFKIKTGILYKYEVLHTWGATFKSGATGLPADYARFLMNEYIKNKLNIDLKPGENGVLKMWELYPPVIELITL